MGLCWCVVGVVGVGFDQQDVGDYYVEVDGFVQVDVFVQLGDVDCCDQDDVNVFLKGVGDFDGDMFDCQGEEEIGQVDYFVYQQYVCDRGVGGGQFYRGGVDYFGVDSQ